MPTFDPFDPLGRLQDAATGASESMEDVKKTMADLYEGTEERLAKIAVDMVYSAIRDGRVFIPKLKQKDWLKNATRKKRLQSYPRPTKRRHPSR